MGSEIINSEVDAGFSAAGLNFKVITSDYKSHKTTKDSGAAFQTTQRTDQPALSNLVFEFIMLFPSARPLIDQIDIQPNVVQVVRGARKIGEFNLDSLLCLRGKKLTPI